MTADRHGCITTYEETSLSMMIKREGMSAAKRSSSLPEARGISLRRLREIMRHSEMLTKSSSWIWYLAPLILLIHCICSVQLPISFFFASYVDSISNESSAVEVLIDINHRMPRPSFLYLSLSLTLFLPIWGTYLIHLTSCLCVENIFLFYFFNPTDVDDDQ